MAFLQSVKLVYFFISYIMSGGGCRRGGGGRRWKAPPDLKPEGLN